MSDPSDQMLAVLRSEIGKLVMENAALKAHAQALEAQNKELRAAKETPGPMTEAERQALISRGFLSRQMPQPSE